MKGQYADLTEEEARDNAFFNGTGTWLRPSLTELIDTIETAWKDRDLCVEKGKAAVKSIKKLDGWKTSAKRIYKHLYCN